MCGFVGVYSEVYSKDELHAHTVKAANSIYHRGPDDAGVWVGDHGIAFGHQRLAVLDLSPLGHQPYISPKKKQVLAYNGEIYNFKSLRGELESRGRSFESSGDTEVLSIAIEEWGVEETLKRVNGMFAFALWDSETQTITLARDRVGIKPLYYGWCGLGFFFGSDLKAFFNYPGFQAPICQSATTLFFQHGYIPHPYCILDGFYKLSPGMMLTLSLSDLKSKGAEHNPVPYWSIEPESEISKMSYEDSVQELHRLFLDSVRLRTISDVPVGAFLSGGIDSSAVVAMLVENSDGGGVETFSIGFEEDEYNEAPYAREIAHHLGTKHHELYVQPEQALSVIPELSDIYSEPFADSSQIPTVLVSRLARKHVTVSLSGDGGDELFSGYSRYTLAPELWRYLKFLPRTLRQIIGYGLHAAPQKFWEGGYQMVQSLLPMRARGLHHVGGKVHTLASVIDSKSVGELYCRANTHWREPYFPTAFREVDTVLQKRELEAVFSSSIEYFSFLDLHTYLPDDILTKVDRASMSCSLEARVPLLDHRIVEFSRKLNPDFKVYGGVQKKILRELLSKYVPKKLFERPKAGFGVPLPSWLRGPLRGWGEELLSRENLPESGILDRKMVLDFWNAHQNGERDAHYPLWDVLIFQAWVKRWRSNILF